MVRPKQALEPVERKERVPHSTCACGALTGPVPPRSVGNLPLHRHEAGGGVAKHMPGTPPPPQRCPECRQKPRQRGGVSLAVSASLAILAILTAATADTSENHYGRLVNDKWTFSSVPGVWVGGREATRTWDDSEGVIQLFDFRRRADGEPFYVHHAMTGVCGDSGKESSCMLHRFLGYYDELGRFLGYSVDKNVPFTRAEHEPFSRPDYALLDRIVRDASHPIGELKVDRKTVDAVTGATAKYVAGKAVPGAFYTSLTVWRLVNRTIPAQLEAWTLERADMAYVRTWLHRGNRLKVWWFLDHADDSPLPTATRADLAYEALASMDADIQIAAIRYLNRAEAPFRPEQALAARYAEIDTVAKSNFLAWWQRNTHAPSELLDALLAEVRDNADKATPVMVQVLTFLSGTDAVRGERWKSVLENVARRNPSTYVRRKAAELAQ
jgi:hypothetical protein